MSTSDTSPHQADREAPMERMARKVKAAHLTGLPEARPLSPDPFRASVLRGLWLGIALGAMAGLAFAALLRSHTLVVGGWEQLYSAGDFTLYVLWAFIGAAVGIATVGVVGLLLAAPTFDPRSESRDHSPH